LTLRATKEMIRRILAARRLPVGGRRGHGRDVLHQRGLPGGRHGHFSPSEKPGWTGR
jgi:hypothetical protein